MLAVDVGGTTSRAALVGYRTYRLIAESPTPTVFASSRDGDEVLADVITWIHRAVQTSQLPIGDLKLAIAFAGGVSGGVVSSAPDIWGAALCDVALSSLLADELGCDVSQIALVNDVVAAALTYADAVASRRDIPLAVLTISTGIGCQVSMAPSERLVPHAMVSLGHRTVGRPPAMTAPQRCSCGEHDHLTCFASGRGLEATVAALGRPATTREIFAAHRRGDRAARRLVSQSVNMIAETLMAELPREVRRVVVRGGLATAAPDVYTQDLGRACAAISCATGRTAPEFVGGSTDNSDTYIGAALALRSQLARGGV